VRVEFAEMEFPIQPLAQTAKMESQIADFRLTRHTSSSDKAANNALDRDLQDFLKAPDAKQISATLVVEKPQR